MDVLQNKGEEPYNSNHMRMTHHTQAGGENILSYLLLGTF